MFDQGADGVPSAVEQKVFERAPASPVPGIPAFPVAGDTERNTGGIGGALAQAVIARVVCLTRPRF